MSKLIIRHAVASDCDALLVLMKKLAKFEDYIDDFTVTVDDLLTHGFPKTKAQLENSHPDFIAIVAEQDAKLLGYLVYYFIPFTYDLKPTLFIKELYVDAQSRGKNIGKQLMESAISDAKEQGCGRMKWDVLSDNFKAQSFYQSFGAVYDAQWQGYRLDV